MLVGVACVGDKAKGRRGKELLGKGKEMEIYCFFLQAEDGIRDLVRSRGLGDVYKRQGAGRSGYTGTWTSPRGPPGTSATTGSSITWAIPTLSLIHI